VGINEVGSGNAEGGKKAKAEKEVKVGRWEGAKVGTV